MPNQSCLDIPNNLGFLTGKICVLAINMIWKLFLSFSERVFCGKPEEMRLTGKKFIPGIRIEVKEDEPEEKTVQKNETKDGILDKLSSISISTVEFQPQGDTDISGVDPNAELENENDQEYTYESSAETSKLRNHFSAANYIFSCDQMLCISTSFWVLSAPESCAKYFFQSF